MTRQPMPIDQTMPNVPKRRGRPPTVKTAPEAQVQRNSPRPAPRATAREEGRELSRETTRPGAEVAIGRDGVPLTRRRSTAGGDLYETPPPPEGWSYQWNSISAFNKEMDEMQILMHENGWRPVPASRYPGRWTPPGFEGAIVVKGLRLEERPASLTDEARYEDGMRAKAQTRDQTDALRLTQKKLPGSREAAGSEVARRAGMNRVNVQLDKRLDVDIPRPQHILDEE